MLPAALMGSITCGQNGLALKTKVSFGKLKSRLWKLMLVLETEVLVLETEGLFWEAEGLVLETEVSLLIITKTRLHF